jgi:hypothetical protein
MKMPLRKRLAAHFGLRKFSTLVTKENGYETGIQPKQSPSKLIFPRDEEDLKNGPERTQKYVRIHFSNLTKYSGKKKREELVDRSGHSQHRDHLTETLTFQGSSRAIDTSQIAALYIKDRLSTPQIAEKLACSKSFVITTLKRQGLLRCKSAAQTDPTNYRNPAPPYGYRVADGKLTPHPAEMKICRLIVSLIDDRGHNYLQAAQHLLQKQVKNRRGQVVWHHYTVSRIYARWKGKL